MSNKLIDYADIVRGKYLFELNKCLDTAEFVKAKFKNDQKNIKKFCNILYKKLK